MIGDILRHWRYFIPRFLGYGTVLGGLFGGLTYPILGVFIGAPWGFAGGLLLGILMGIGVPIYNRFFASEDKETYQAQLTFGAGLVATALMAVPLLFIYSLVAGMVTAYITHQYAENPAHLGEKRKHSVDSAQKRDNVFTRATSAMMSKASYFITITISLALLMYTANSFTSPFASFRWIEFLLLGVGGAIYGSIVASMIAAVNGLFIVMSNRLFFNPEMSKSQYKARIVPMVGVLTLFLSMIVTVGIGAPFAAIVGAFGASKYADWYYELHEEEKAKRDAHHLLEQAFDDEDDDYYIEDEEEYKDRMLLR